MTRAEVLNRIPAQDWEATPASVRNVLLALVQERGASEALPELSVSGETAAERVKRHQELVDRLFLKGLSAEEVQELEQLKAQIDSSNALFYDAALQRMEVAASQKE